LPLNRPNQLTCQTFRMTGTRMVLRLPSPWLFSGAPDRHMGVIGSFTPKFLNLHLDLSLHNRGPMLAGLPEYSAHPILAVLNRIKSRLSSVFLRYGTVLVSYDCRALGLRPNSVSGDKTRTWHVLGTAAVVAVAALLRLCQLTLKPLHHDEGVSITSGSGACAWIAWRNSLSRRERNPDEAYRNLPFPFDPRTARGCLRCLAGWNQPDLRACQ
jgi:hypothetical protein